MPVIVKGALFKRTTLPLVVFVALKLDTVLGVLTGFFRLIPVTALAISRLAVIVPVPFSVIESPAVRVTLPLVVILAPLNRRTTRPMAVAVMRPLHVATFA